MSEIGQKAAEGFAMESFECVHQDMPRIVKLPIAIEEQTLQLRPAQVRMAKRCCRPIQTIEIWFGNPARRKEVVVLLCSRNRCEDIKRRNVRIEAEQHIKVLANAFCRVLRKPDDV